jgi:hypothetical protein
VRRPGHWSALPVGGMIAPRSSAISSPWREPLGRHLKRMQIPRAGGGPYFAFQMADVAVPRMSFAENLRLIAELRPPLDAAPA